MSPCRARVPSTTENAVTTIKSRNGNPAGSASAAASVTMPRMPDQEITSPLPTVGRSMGRGGRNPNRRSCHLMTALKDMCHAIRTTITVTRTAPATTKYRPRIAGSRLSKIGRICSPMKTNASTFKTNTTVSHTAYEGMRSRAGMRAGAVRATVIA